jgi:hypothetical protein
MTDPTPFPTDPLEPEGVDPDLSSDDERQQSPGADEERPDDRAPTVDEQRQDQVAAEEQGRNEDYPPVP